MKKLISFGTFLSFLFPFVLFMSYKGEQTLSYIIMLFFLISMISKKNRTILKNLIDGKLVIGLIIFILTPFIISLVSGGIFSRVDIDHYLYWLIFFPLIFFINTEKKFRYFITSFFVGGVISLCITLIIFINNYDSWKNPNGFEYKRVYFALQTQDFANIMCILLLFIFSFLLFYRNKDRTRNFLIKTMLLCVFLLNLFIIIVNRSKMVYICLIPTIIYILYKKNKKYILGFLTLCIGGYFVLPFSIRDRLQYIVKFKEDPSSNLRLIFWDAAINSFKNSFFFGMTTKQRIEFNISHFKKNGVWQYIADNYGVNDEIGLTNTHNMYLHYLAYFGLGILSLIYFFFITIPGRLLKINYYKSQNAIFSQYIALEIGLKASYIAYLIQGITEYNLNKKPMIFLCVIFLVIINFICKTLLKNDDSSNSDSSKI